MLATQVLRRCDEARAARAHAEVFYIGRLFQLYLILKDANSLVQCLYVDIWLLMFVLHDVCVTRLS